MTWFNSNSAKQLLIYEKAIVDSFLKDKFGYFAVQLGGLDCNFLTQSRISKHLFNGGINKNISFHCAAIPFNSDSIDLIVCPHVNEELTDNDSFFEELSRVIIPSGYALIISFNPYSFAGLRKIFGFDNENPWNCKFKSLRDTQNALKKHGFLVEQAKIFHYQPVFDDNSTRYIDHFESVGGRWFPLLGNVYCLLAKKMIPEMTPIKPRWNRPKKIAVALNKGRI